MAAELSTGRAGAGARLEIQPQIQAASRMGDGAAGNTVDAGGRHLGDPRCRMS